MFEVVNEQPFHGAHFDLAPANRGASDKESLARNSLEAHQTLMDIDPANIPKFKDFTQFLREDLARKKKTSEP